MKLGALTNIRTGKLDANASSPDGEYPFFTCARKPLRINTYSYDCECILVAGNGDLNVKYYVGKFDAYQRTYIVEAKQTSSREIHLRYIYHFLEVYVETLREQSIGGIIKYIKMGNLTEAEIPLPPLAEQERIAGILDAADGLRAKRRDALAQLDTLLQSTFLTLFGDPVTNPMGWEVKPMGQCCEILTGFAFKSKQFLKAGQGVRLCRGINVGIDRLAWKDQADWNSSYEKNVIRYEIHAGDIILAMDRPWISSGLKVAIATESDIPALLVQRVARIRASLNCMQRIVYLLIRNDAFIRHCAPTETTIPHISPKDLRTFPIYHPPLPLQHRFATIVESIEAQKAKQREHLAELDALFASLQHRAFAGAL